MKHDRMLLFFLTMAEQQAPVEIPITLNVHGLIVTGVLCSRSEYEVQAEAILSQMSGGYEGDAFAEFHRVIKKWESDESAAEDDDLDAVFVHMKDAIYLTSGSLAVNARLPWRGKLSSIDAWSAGKICINFGS